MNRPYYFHMLTRGLIAIAVLIGFCLLPGPRSLLRQAADYMLSPASIESLRAGFHLSLNHFCWLFGLDMQSLPYPETVDPSLAAIALLGSVAFQILVVTMIYFYLRGMFTWYDDDGPEPTDDDLEEETISV